MIASQVRSSLPYQVLIHINKPFSICLWCFLIIVYFYKGQVLPYPNHVRIMEFLIILLFAPIEMFRLNSATRGNLTETPAYVGFSALLSLPSFVICVYLGIFQNFILLLEEVVVCIEAVLIILETLLSLVLFATLSRPTTIG
ncbi:unnamed protein product, partial [Mesorhabditis belari]|uniref:Transmembrane protein 216 n=1 Tax=Mesorhabditis belari TaxID=2138241 RepID=A0AAF3F558_9BILA